jgi:hypothetical protein
LGRTIVSTTVFPPDPKRSTYVNLFIEVGETDGFALVTEERLMTSLGLARRNKRRGVARVLESVGGGE